MKFLRKILDKVMFLLGGNSEIRKWSVDEGVCNFEGQGRDTYGQ